MRKRAFIPDGFALGLLVVGALVLIFPSLRVTGIIAIALAATYWLLMGLITTFRR